VQRGDQHRGPGPRPPPPLGRAPRAPGTRPARRRRAANPGGRRGNRPRPRPRLEPGVAGGAGQAERHDPVTSGTAAEEPEAQVGQASAWTSPSAPSARSSPGARPSRARPPRPRPPRPAEHVRRDPRDRSVARAERAGHHRGGARAEADAEARRGHRQRHREAERGQGIAPEQARRAKSPPVARRTWRRGPGRGAGSLLNSKGPTGPSVIRTRRRGVGGGAGVWPGPQGIASVMPEPSFAPAPRSSDADRAARPDDTALVLCKSAIHSFLGELGASP
jgi:hypothetical protein